MKQLPQKKLLLAGVGFIILLLGLMVIYPFFNGDKQKPQTQQQTHEKSKAPISKAEKNAPFDFYLLSLSWSPTFCQENPNKRSKGDLQCRQNAPRPYAFIVHGLWPQNNKGWPQFCQENPRGVEKSVLNTMLDIMPSKGLIKHQWKKHGTCSGLDAKAYFEKTRAAFQRIKVPQKFQRLEDYLTTSPKAVEKAFLENNPNLASNMLTITCSRNYLQEVRICMDKALNFRPCPALDKAGCRRKTMAMPPVR